MLRFRRWCTNENDLACMVYASLDLLSPRSWRRRWWWWWRMEKLWLPLYELCLGETHVMSSIIIHTHTSYGVYALAHINRFIPFTFSFYLKCHMKCAQRHRYEQWSFYFFVFKKNRFFFRVDVLVSCRFCFTFDSFIPLLFFIIHVLMKWPLWARAINNNVYRDLLVCVCFCFSLVLSVALSCVMKSIGLSSYFFLSVRSNEREKTNR